MSDLTRTAAVALAALAIGQGPAKAEQLTIAVASEPTAIDPHFHNLGPNNAVARHIFDNLINQDARQRLTPGLAVSWEPVQDTVWEFKLREGVTFHDGSAFDADDVVCSFERAPNVPNSPSSFATYTKGKTVEKVDQYTVHFITEEPYPLMANDVSTIPIVSNETGCEATTQAFNDGTAAIGTGPFRFVSYTPGESIELARNDDYWGDVSLINRSTTASVSDGAR